MEEDKCSSFKDEALSDEDELESEKDSDNQEDESDKESNTSTPNFGDSVDLTPKPAIEILKATQTETLFQRTNPKK
jgi:hypothetical protein